MTENRKVTVNRYHPYKRPDTDEVSIRRRFFVKYHQNVRLIFEPRVTTTMLNMQTMEYMTLSDDLFMKVIDFVSCAKLLIDRYCGLRILARFTYLEGQRRKRRFHPYKRPENLKYIKSQLVWTECIKASLVELGEMKQEHNQEYKSSSVTEMKQITAEISQNSPEVSEILPSKGEDITTHDKTKTDEIVELALSSDEISAPVEISKKSPVVPEILPANREDITTHYEIITDGNVAAFSSHDLIKPDYDITSVEDNCSSQPDFRNPLLLTESQSIQIQEEANTSSIDLGSSTLGNNDNDSVIEIVPLSEQTVLVDNGTTSSQINGVDNDESTRAPVDEKNESSDTPKPTDSFTHLSTNEDSDSEIDSETEEALLRIGSDESDCELSLSETTICRLLEIDPPDKLDKKIESAKTNIDPQNVANTSEADRTTCNSTEVDELHDETATDDSKEKIGSAKNNTAPKDVADTSEADRTTCNSTEVDEIHDDNVTDDNIELEEFFTQIDAFLEEVGFKESDVISESEDKTIITEESLTLNDIHTNNSSDQKEEVHPTIQNTICVERDVKTSKSVLVAKESLLTNNGLEHSKTRCDTVKTLSIDSDNSNNDVGPKSSIIPCDTESSQADERKRIDIPMSASMDEHKQALEKASNSGIELEEPGTTNSGALEEKFENKEMPENACLHENHQQRQPLGETKSNTGLEFSTEDCTTPVVFEDFNPGEIKQEMPRIIKPELSDQAVFREMKKDQTIQNKPIELPKQAMLKDEKPNLLKKAKPKDVKPELPKLIKLNDIKLELAKLVKLNGKKPKIVKQAKPKGIKPEFSKLDGVNETNPELSIQKKLIDVKPELPKQANLKDDKPELSNQANPVEMKLMLPKQVKSNDIKLEATKQAKLSNEKLELSKQTHPMAAKSELSKQAKLNDVKSELPKYTRPKDVNLTSTNQKKPNDVVKFVVNKKPKFVPIPIKYRNDDKPRRVQGKNKQEIESTEEKSKTTVYCKVLPPKQKYTPAPLSNNVTDKTSDGYNKAWSVKTIVVDNSVKNHKLVTQMSTSEQSKCAEDSKSRVKAVATKPKYKPNPKQFGEKKNQNVHQNDVVPKPKYRPNPTKSALVQKGSADQGVVALKKKFKPVPIVLGEEIKASAEATMPDSKVFKPKPIESLEKNEANINKEVVASKPKFKSVPIIFGEGKEPRKDIEIKASTPSFQDFHAKHGQESKTSVLAEAKAPKRKFKPVSITLSDEGNRKLDKFNPEQPIGAVPPKRKFRPTPITFGEEHRKVDMLSQEHCVEAVEPKRKFKPTPISFGNDGHRKFDTVSKEERVTGVVETRKPKFKPTPILFENQGLRKIAKSSQEERVEYRNRRFASCLDDTGPRKLKLRY